MGSAGRKVRGRWTSPEYFLRAPRCARNALPKVIETREVQASDLPKGNTLNEFRELGKGPMIQRFEHVHRAAEQPMPVYDELKRVVRLNRYVHDDETGQPVLGKDKYFRGWMWVILSKQAIVYQYSNGRASSTAKK